MSDYDEILRRAKDVTIEHKNQQAMIRRMKHGKMVKNIFFGLLLIAILLYGGKAVYQNQEKIIATIEAKTGINPLAILTPAPTSVSVADPLPDPCVAITVETTEGSQMKITPTPKVGQCYIIAEDSLEGWNKVVGNQAELSRFSQYIYDKSTDKSLTVEQIAERLTASTNRNLDLRSTQVQTSPTQEIAPATQESTPTIQPTPTEIPPTPTPEATPTPSVIVVPWPEKEHGFTLEELVRVMAEHNIQSVSGENHGTTPQDRIRWALYYNIDGSTTDYLVFSMLNSDLPEACKEGNFLSVSFSSTGDPLEKWHTVSGTQIAFVCK